MSNNVNIYALISGLIAHKYEVIVDKDFNKYQLAILARNVESGLLRTGTGYDNPKGLGPEIRYWALNILTLENEPITSMAERALLKNK